MFAGVIIVKGLFNETITHNNSNCGIAPITDVLCEGRDYGREGEAAGVRGVHPDR